MDKKVGRPRQTKKAQRNNVLRVCLTDSERHAIEVAAQKHHLNTSAWVRSLILTEAEKFS